MRKLLSPSEGLRDGHLRRRLGWLLLPQLYPEGVYDYRQNRTRKGNKMRQLNNVLLTTAGILLLAMVMWVSERDQLLGYVLGVALIGLMIFIVVERLNPRR